MCDIYVLYINNLLYKYLIIDYTYVKLENNIEFLKKRDEKEMKKKKYPSFQTIEF